MSLDQSIFVAQQNDSSANPSETTNAQTATTSAEIVSVLVGEGKKYRTVDDLAKAYMSADDFIEKLKAENHELREKATASKTIDDVLERLQQQHATPSEDNGRDRTSPVEVADLTKLVEATVTGLETKKQKSNNLLKADSKMKELFGDKASQKFAEVASTPELKEVYMQLASVDPDKFVSLFAGNALKSTGVETGSGVNTTVSYSSGNSSRVHQVGTKEYFDNIRRTSPNTYYSQSFQMTMDKAVRSNPDLYYGKR